jgi:sugar lactone lactonase YvrE
MGRLQDRSGEARAAWLVLAALLLLLAAAPVAAALPREYTLPGASVFPEGVTTRPGTDQFFVSSTSDGTIFRGTLGRAAMKPFLAPGVDGRVNAVGLRATRTHLIVAGGVTGLIFVYDLRNGRLVRRFSIGSGGFVNDVAIAPGGDAYLTDSERGSIFRIPARAAIQRRKRTKQLRPFVRLSATPVGSYSNGVVFAGRRYLLVVGTSTGVLGRVDLRTKRVRAVDLNGGTLAAGDGLARRGRTLYVVNLASRVTQLKLSGRWSRASISRQITSPRFRFPTTVAVAGRRLLVVNSQFNQRGGSPVLPFSVSAVARP